MFLSQLANSTVVIMNLVTGTKYSGISQILATNHKNIKISEMTLSCSKLMRLKIGGKKKESGPIILDRLLTGAYSQARSHY
jgi:hypothetical protein